MNMSKQKNLKVAEEFFQSFQDEPSWESLEAWSYYYLFKWAGYRE